MTDERRQDAVLVALMASAAIHVALMLLVRSEVMTRPASGIAKPSHREPMRIVNRAQRPDPAKIEVMDLRGNLALFSVGDGRLTTVPGRPGDFECYPTWDPTGQLLFTCCAETPFTNDVEDVRIRTEKIVGAYTNMFYGVRVRRFDLATQTFSAPEVVIDGNSSRMSCAFPRISPDGRWMVLTVSRFGVFPIWHKSADLWLLDLKMLKVRPLDELNSQETESWHEFSSNGKWMVFSTRRGDGTFTRPWIARFDASTGRFDRPFPLPLEDPEDDFRQMKSYNLPTFLK